MEGARMGLDELYRYDGAVHLDTTTLVQIH